MIHRAAPSFHACYQQLPASVRKAADSAFALLKADPRHPALRLKKAGQYWCVRIGLHHRALGHPIAGGVLRFWIGTHAEYDKILGR